VRGASYLRGVISLNPEQELLGFLLLGAWAGCVAYRLEYHRAPFWVYGYLVVKVLAAWVFGWVYASYYCHGDTLKLYSTAGRLWHYLVQEPGAGVALLFREFSQRFEEVGWAVYYRDVRLYDYDYDYFDAGELSLCSASDAVVCGGGRGVLWDARTDGAFIWAFVVWGV
jgi:hypothetical protein